MNSKEINQVSTSNKHKQCPLCLNESIFPFKSGKFSFELFKCKNCAFVFSADIPSEKELQNFYNHYPDYSELSEITIKRYNELLDTFEPFRKNNKILDVGCGHGHFLEEAKKRGWNVYGTEYTEKAVSICSAKGIIMHLGALSTFDSTSVDFDIVTSIEVLEHVSMVSVLMQNYFKHLRIGGALYITTPNFNSLSRIMLKSDWRVITYPEHLSYFSSKSISYLIDQCGHKIKFLETTGLSLNEIKQHFLSRKRKGSGLVKNSTEAQTELSLREKIEGNKFSLLLKKLVNSILSLFKIGDSIKLMCIKKGNP